ncbi:MAG TPA: histidine phosphatase family protein [Stellaceae bacterium]|jgi:broad specificity phosphatase PhoE|nr:histidine phosphatase family protein [Stellaceae bacterium]
MPARQILLVRHCQSQANADGRIEGRGDSPLSEEGLRQADEVAARIASRSLGAARLVASSQARAIATAAAIGAACGWTTYAHDHRIREGDLGWMEDLSYTEVGRLMAERKVRELDADLHGGESLQVVADRVWEALGEALAAHDGVIVLVSHGYTIQALLRRLDPDVAIPRFIGNGDVVELWLEDGALASPPTHVPLKPPPDPGSTAA